MSLLNKSEVKKLALSLASRRAHKLTRVSKEFLEDMDVKLRYLIQKHIDGLPSIGKTIFGVILCLGIYSCQPAFAHPINMEILAEIESSNNPNAYNKSSHARGLYQITPIVLKQYNSEENYDEKFSELDMHDIGKASKVAYYYLGWLSERCDTVDEILIAWNWGIGNFRKWQRAYCRDDNYAPGRVDVPPTCSSLLPKETQDFLKKYHEKEPA